MTKIKWDGDRRFIHAADALIEALKAEHPIDSPMCDICMAIEVYKKARAKVEGGN